MTRNENLVVQLGKEIPCPVSDMFLEAESEIFDAKLIFLFCEGKGEFNYFNGYQLGIKSSRIKVVPRYPDQERREGSDIKKISQQVCKAIENSEVEVKHDGSRKKYQVDDIDEFKVIFDRDTNFRINKRTERSKYEEAKELIDDRKVELFLSNYSFEVWILCHFIKPSRSIKSTRLKKEIEKVWDLGPYSKSDNMIFDKIKDNLDTAISNAERLLEEKRSDGVIIHSEESNPVTEIGMLIEYLSKTGLG